MKKKRIVLDEDDAPELTDEILKRLRPAREVLPEIFGQAIADDLLKRKPGQRGKQKAPTKKGVYIRLDADILRHFKSTGPGWQSRINNFLKAAVANLV